MAFHIRVVKESVVCVRVLFLLHQIPHIENIIPIIKKKSIEIERHVSFRQCKLPGAT